MKPFWTVALLLFALVSCSPPRTQPLIAPVSTVPATTISPTDAPAPTSANMPNPASAFCIKQGYKNERLGYSFQHPADAKIVIADEPQRSLIISDPGMGGENWVISHPSDRDEFSPPENVDLFQWLTDHYLVGEKRMPDTQIAGTLAIHFRHEHCPQSPADDRYSFALSGQLYMVLIGHGETEDGELNNRFLQSIQFDGNMPEYQGWWTYTHPVYNTWQDWYTA